MSAALNMKPINVGLLGIGTVGGGTSKNTVPDRAEAAVDLRFVTPPDGVALLAALDAGARDSAATLPGTSIEVVRGPSRAPLVRDDRNVALYRAYGACARAAGLGAGEAPLLGGGSDASTTAAMGIPSIDGLGPRGSGFHTTDEVVEVASLAPKAEALARLLRTRFDADVQTVAARLDAENADGLLADCDAALEGSDDASA